MSRVRRVQQRSPIANASIFSPRSATDFVLQAIENLNVDMTVFMSIYIDNNDTTWERQYAEGLWTLSHYGVDHIDGVTVGNEVLFNGWLTEAELVERIATVRTQVNSMGFSKTLPVGTSDLGSNIDTALVAGSDYVMANVHPFFAPNPVDTAATWTWDFFAQNDVIYANETTFPTYNAGATKNVPAMISETGWPTRGPANGTAVPGISELQTFLDTFICQSNQMGLPYYFFEAFDEPWKIIYDETETSWGLFNANKTLKAGITVPDCSVGTTYWGGFGDGSIVNNFNITADLNN